MGLHIEDDDAMRIARELAHLTGESLTEVVVLSLRERLERLQRRRVSSTLVDDIERIGRRNSTRKVLDKSSAEEILGYDQSGIPS